MRHSDLDRSRMVFFSSQWVPGAPALTRALIPADRRWDASAHVVHERDTEGTRDPTWPAGRVVAAIHTPGVDRCSPSVLSALSQTGRPSGRRTYKKEARNAAQVHARAWGGCISRRAMRMTEFIDSPRSRAVSASGSMSCRGSPRLCSVLPPLSSLPLLAAPSHPHQSHGLRAGGHRSRE